jgi:hypothetical protein
MTFGDESVFKNFEHAAVAEAHQGLQPVERDALFHFFGHLFPVQVKINAHLSPPFACNLLEAHGADGLAAHVRLAISSYA